MSDPLDSLTCPQFLELVGATFELRLESGSPVSVELAEARELGHRRPGAKREPFALLFRDPARHHFPQGIYRFENERLGSMEIFVTPVGDGPDGSLLEAVFT